MEGGGRRWKVEGGRWKEDGGRRRVEGDGLERDGVEGGGRRMVEEVQGLQADPSHRVAGGGAVHPQHGLPVDSRAL